MQIDFSKYSSIKIGPILEVRIIEDFEKLKPKENIIGGANNILISNNPPPLAMLSSKFDYIHIKDNTLVVGAATKSSKLLTFCKKHNIKNFELLQKLPGSIGGLTKMNAGLKEWEIFNHLNYVKTDDKIIKKEDINYSYRHSDIEGIIYEVGFDIEVGFNNAILGFFKDLRDNQPNNPSAGSCFKNPPNDYAARLIEAVGLKGKEFGNVSFSKKHANFLVNRGSATYDEAINLIRIAQKEVRDKFNIELELEIQVI
ncbi:MAG: UDP-N-acetylenolpyruvoylglucosamine reductase (EC [uncultured Campylobacterales bacterium]|uniref:UDP-N-acetylenolpyruvoylglucosamine reductase n=1 Tax=uncultured Campylobacterales bacterium TaxID=352960 RepID=A0A6S6SZF2_9BACT|nr:MAG: UDP-N-acetylenolpyruvoylglucosamine reductase (EC [uncultured Campylobacterales bacterium]